VIDIPGSQNTVQIEIPKHGNKYSTLHVLLSACKCLIPAAGRVSAKVTV